MKFLEKDSLPPVVHFSRLFEVITIGPSTSVAIRTEYTLASSLLC